MGDLTRTELIEEVKKGVGNRSDFPEERIIRHLNLAQTRIARKHTFIELNIVDSAVISITGDLTVDRTHTFVPKIRHIHSLVRVIADETPVKLVGVPSHQWSHLVGAAYEYSSGDPTHYNEWNSGTIEFWRVPNRSFTLLRKYRKWPADLILSDQLSDLEHKDDVILAFALSSLFRSLGQDADAVSHFAIARAILDEAILMDQQRPDDSQLFRGVSEAEVSTGNYVNDPFIRSAP
jgi:hypothetical protein